MTKVECLGVGFVLVGDDICDFGGVFIAMVVEMEVNDLELEVELGDVVSLVCGCVNGRLYFLWHLSRRENV